MDMRQLVGRRVRQFRLAKNLTQERFAEACGFSQAYLSGLESGRRNPTIVTLFEIAQALEVAPHTLITPEEPEG